MSKIFHLDYVRSYPCIRMISESDIVLMYRRLRNIFEEKKMEERLISL